MDKEKELEKEILKNILECPYNKYKQSKEHNCSNCDIPNDILRAELKGYQQAKSDLQKQVFDKIDELKCYCESCAFEGTHGKSDYKLIKEKALKESLKEVLVK